MDRDKLIGVLRALGDPTRLSIFELLMQGTHCNCVMGERLGLPANLISHHVRVLRQAGLVRAERHPRDARWILYSVDTEFLAQARDEVATLLDPVRVPTGQECWIGRLPGGEAVEPDYGCERACRPVASGE